MWNRWSRIAFALVALGTVVFLGLVVNQTAQLVSLANALHPTAGTAVLGVLLVVYAVCLLVPIVLFVRLPKPLQPPLIDEGREFERHLRALGRRLAANERAGPGPFRTREEIEAGLERLGARADDIARRSGSEVFIATAVSQHGSLDALVMLGIQARMIWRIAHVYHQRPGARELVHLYANVGVTAFIAGELEDMDISDHIQPVVSGVFGSVAASVPGLQTASNVFVTSVLGGATNAFLTLRVAMIAKQYCARADVPAAPESPPRRRRAGRRDARRHRAHRHPPRLAGAADRLGAHGQRDRPPSRAAGARRGVRRWRTVWDRRAAHRKRGPAGAPIRNPERPAGSGWRRGRRAPPIPSRGLRIRPWPPPPRDPAPTRLTSLRSAGAAPSSTPTRGGTLRPQTHFVAFYGQTDGPNQPSIFQTAMPPACLPMSTAPTRSAVGTW